MALGAGVVVITHDRRRREAGPIDAELRAIARQTVIAVLLRRTGRRRPADARQAHTASRVARRPVGQRREGAGPKRLVADLAGTGVGIFAELRDAWDALATDAEFLAIAGAAVTAVGVVRAARGPAANASQAHQAGSAGSVVGSSRMKAAAIGLRADVLRARVNIIAGGLRAWGARAAEANLSAVAGASIAALAVVRAAKVADPSKTNVAAAAAGSVRQELTETPHIWEAGVQRADVVVVAGQREARGAGSCEAALDAVAAVAVVAVGVADALWQVTRPV